MAAWLITLALAVASAVGLIYWHAEAADGVEPIRMIDIKRMV